MRIGIDIDDTISDSYEPSFAYAQLYTLNDLKREIKLNYEVSKHHSYIKQMHGWTDEESNNFWNKYYNEIIYLIKPYTFAPEYISKLKEDGDEIILITARWSMLNFDVNEATKKWLEMNKIKYDELETNAREKAQIAKEKNLDLFIDDSFKNCTDVANTGIKTFMMETRTNKGLEADNITRVYSWPDIYKKITDMKKGNE